jgi:peptidoglycan LD-endopeptidase LytH
VTRREAAWGASATFGLGVGAGALWGVLAMSCAVLEAARPGPPPPPPQLYRPLPGLDPSRVLSGFDDARGGRRHEAVDLAAPRGTPVSAVAAGRIARLPSGGSGGIAIEQIAEGAQLCLYYAHLERYAAGLQEGQHVVAGELLGFVGTTGNAPENAPHLHLAAFRLGPEQSCWEGTPVDPYPLLFGSG